MVSVWTQTACVTVRACKPERALQAGIQVFLDIKLDSRLRGNDVVWLFNVTRLSQDQ